MLFLSTRITEDAYVSLIEATGASTILVDSSFEHLKLPLQKRASVQVECICSTQDFKGPIYGSEAPSLPSQHLEDKLEGNNTAWIIHSSGSTGQPKPIFQTHQVALRNYANNFGLRGFITLPLFHAHGISCLFRAIHAKKLIYMYNASLPLTAQHLMTTLSEHPDIQILYAVPYGLKLLSESDEGIRCLAALDLVMFGGSACPKPIGDKLASRGVLLVSHYGTTETGQLMTSFRERSDVDWDYVRPTPNLLPFLRWEEQSPGIFELCVLPGWPSKVATNRPDGSYATKDLFEQHPTSPNAWRYYARLDDTLVLENGEKANPLLLEGVAKENPNVAEAVVFGANKPRLGIFIVPAETTPCKTDYDLVDTVWPALDRANANVPAFSRISREMVKVLPQTASYRKTDKGTVIRAAFYRDMASLIDATYQEIASGSLVLEGQDLVKFLRSLLLDVANLAPGVELKDDTDLFALGVDSLQAIRLRSAIQAHLDIGKSTLPQNFVFENPSLAAMAKELVRLRLGQTRQQSLSVEEKMTALIEKYSDFAQHTPMASRDNYGDQIVVTGATGSLGAHIVAKLASEPTTARVWCLVRANDKKGARERVRKSMMARCVYHTLSMEARMKITAVPSDLSESHLGLDHAAYDHIVSRITGLIHCAWSVNFNLALESFERSCIAGTRHLLDLCLRARRPTPARFAFCSSVSTVAATPGNLAPEALPPSLLHAQGMGYAQSKLVTEHIVARAVAQTGIQAQVLRVGQIIADTKHGVWNSQEAIPMIFQTAKTIHSLPELEETPSWTPVDVVANSVIELTAVDSPQLVYNVTNPRTFHWTDDLLPLLRESGLVFDILSPREWVTKLRASDPDPSSNPPIKLVEFFASKYDKDHTADPPRKLGYDTSGAERDSPSLRGAKVVDSELVQRFIQHFEAGSWNSASEQQCTGVYIVCGACGSGKSTLATRIATKLSIPMIEGDEIHTDGDRASMGAGRPLAEAERWAWLGRIRGAVEGTQNVGKSKAVVVTCSALKSAYRDALRKLNESGSYDVRFLLLSSDKGTLEGRMRHREGHYMKAEMVDSQLSLLEKAREDETDVTLIDSDRAVDDVVKEALEVIRGSIVI